jgi:hypothetical protein
MLSAQKDLTCVPPGSSTIRLTLSHKTVWPRAGSAGVQARSGFVGFPVLAKLAHDAATFLARARASDCAALRQADSHRAKASNLFPRMRPLGPDCMCAHSCFLPYRRILIPEQACLISFASEEPVQRGEHTYYPLKQASRVRRT